MSGESEIHDHSHYNKPHEQLPQHEPGFTLEQSQELGQVPQFEQVGNPNAQSGLDRGGRERHMHGVQQQLGNAYAQRMIHRESWGRTGALAVSRAPKKNTRAQDMQNAADAEEKTVLAMPPPRVGQMSTLNDAEQARQQITQVTRAQDNLFQANSAYKTEKAEAGSSYKGVAEADKKIVQSQKFIDQDEEVKNQLQSIIDLSTGSSTAVSRPGGDPNVDVTVGADMRLSTFSSLYGNLERDFARLQGVVSVFLASAPKVKNDTGASGGFNMGKALATGGRDRSTEAVNTDVQNAERRDPVLLDKVREFKTKLDNYTGANHTQLIETAVRACGMRTNELKNLATDLSLPGQRQDTPEEATAKADIAKINADLAGAKKGLDQIQAVFKLAATVAGMPAVGALGAGSTLAGAEATVASGLDMAGKGAGAVKTLTDVDIADSIKNELAKVMTDYTSRMTSANGKLELSQYLKTNLIKKIDMDKINAAKTAMQAAFDALQQAVANAEKQKKEIREAAAQLTKYQAGRGGAGGGPDIAGMAQALGEVTIFIDQAKVTREQGKKQKELSDEMVKRREKMVGNYDQADPSQPGSTDLNGNERIAVAEKEKAYYDSEKVGDLYLYKMNTLRFELWSDQVRQTPDAARFEVEKILKQIDEYLATAEGFKQPLQESMFGA